MNINAPALSKINWTQVIGAAAMVGTVFGLDIPPEKQVSIVTTIGLGTQVLTMVWRTFFTGKKPA